MDPWAPTRISEWLFRDLPATAAAREERWPAGTAQDMRQAARAAAGAEDPAALPQLLKAGASARRAADQHRLALRLHLAELYLATRAGLAGRAREVRYHVTQGHRLLSNNLAAEAHALAALAEPLAPETAAWHVRALTQLSALRQVVEDNGSGTRFAEQAVRLADERAHDPGVRAAQVLALLQLSAVLRTEGDYQGALDAVDLAGSRSNGSTTALVRGQVRLRRAALLLALNDPWRALAELDQAALDFEGTSQINLRVVELRKVAALRMAGDGPRALEQARAVRRLMQGRSPHLALQAALEEAEVLEWLGRTAEAETVLAACEPTAAVSGSLEAARWYNHRARLTVTDPDRQRQAAQHVADALAAGVGRNDLTRTALALSLVCRLDPAALDPGRLDAGTTLAAARAARVLAEAQRGGLVDPHLRGGVQAAREDLFAVAATVEAVHGEPRAVVEALEAGRADLIEDLLATGTSDRGRLLPGTVRDPAAQARALDTAAAVARVLRGGTWDGPPPEAPDGPVLRDPGQGPPRLVLQLVPGTDGLALVRAWDFDGTWHADVVRPDRPAQALLRGLAAGRPLPARGVTADAYRSLALALLPDGAARLDGPFEVSLDPRLWLLPLSALPLPDGRPLAEVALPVLVPSLRAAELLSGRPEQAARADGLVAVLDPALPGYPQEARAVADWPGHSTHDLSGLDPTTRTATAPAHGYAVMYVAGHGTGPGDAATLGIPALTLDGLARLDLPEVVVLAGCWSGTPAGRYGRDPFSLAVGALLGGARTVVAGLGPVGSAATGLVGAELLRGLASGKGPAAALREAQTRLLRRFPQAGPADWAGLSLVGGVR